MSGFDPSVTKEAMNDPAMVLRVLGMLAPNIYYNTPGGGQRPAFRPGMALSALGEGYENVRTRQEQERQLKGMSAGLSEQGMFPWEQEARNLKDAEILKQPTAQEIEQEIPMQVRAGLRPTIAPFGEYMSRLRTPVQFRVAASLEDFYGRRTAEVEKKYDVMKSDLLGEAATVLKKDPFNEDAQNAVLVLLKDAADPKVRGGAAVSLAQTYRTNQASYQMLKDSGLTSEQAKAYVDTGQAQKEIEYTIGRNREIAKATKIAEEMQGILTPASRALVFALAANGMTPPAEWFAQEGRNQQFEFMKTQFPTAWAQLVAGIPLDQQALNRMLQLISEDQEATKTIQTFQTSAIAKSQRDKEIALHARSVVTQENSDARQVIETNARRRHELLTSVQIFGRLATEKEQEMFRFKTDAKNLGYSETETTTMLSSLRGDYDTILANERVFRTQYLKGSPEGQQFLIRGGRTTYDTRLGLLERLDTWVDDPVKVTAVNTTIDALLKDLEKDYAEYMNDLDPVYYRSIKTRLEAIRKVVKERITKQGGPSISRPPEVRTQEEGRGFRPARDWRGPVTPSNPAYTEPPVPR